MKMRVRNGRWYGYAYVYDPVVRKRRQIEFALGAYEQERQKAIINLGKCLEQIERGEFPNTRNFKFSRVAEHWKKNPVSLKGRNHGTDYNFKILDETLIPYFGEMQVRDINHEIVRDYLRLMESDDRPLTKNREGKGFKPVGKSKSTLQKELRLLKWVIHSVDRTWETPHWEFKNLQKEKTEVPSFEQVRKMIEGLYELSSGVRKRSYGKEYQDIAWTMAETGLDVSDVLKLSRSSFKDGLIVGRRGKTKKPYKVAVSNKLKEILKERKTVEISETAPIFQVPSNGAVCTAIRRSFKRMGLSFHGKSLRDYHASMLYNAGFPDNVIQEVLGHTPGSKETHKYTLASKERLKEAAGVFNSLHDVKEGGC